MLVEVGTAPQKHIERILRLLSPVFQFITKKVFKNTHYTCDFDVSLMSEILA